MSATFRAKIRSNGDIVLQLLNNRSVALQRTYSQKEFGDQITWMMRQLIRAHAEKEQPIPQTDGQTEVVPIRGIEAKALSDGDILLMVIAGNMRAPFYLPAEGAKALYDGLGEALSRI